MKSVIITGATRGIGLALARFYADKGYCLMLNGGHNEEALAAVEKELSTKTHLSWFCRRGKDGCYYCSKNFRYFRTD